jgi:hypothetical protein
MNNLEGYNIKSVTDYLKYLRTNFNKDTIIRPGRFYSYHYDFSRDYPIKELRFYDFEPLIFCFETFGNYFLGLNFHHIPPKSRQIWFDRIEKISKELNTVVKMRGLGGRPIYRIYGLNYPKVYQVLRKSKIAIRKYRKDRVYHLRAIDIRKFREVSSFFANTYFDINVNEIISRYNKFRP